MFIFVYFVMTQSGNFWLHTRMNCFSNVSLNYKYTTEIVPENKIILERPIIAEELFLSGRQKMSNCLTSQ